MLQTISFHSQAVDWWLQLRESAGRIGRVHRWLAGDHPPDEQSTGLEQHPTAALVLALAGVVRVEGHRDRVDLAPGDALVMRAGVWHRHAPLRAGSLAFSQAAVGGRSDFFLESQALRFAASWAEQPSRDRLQIIATTSGEGERRRLVGELLRQQLADAVSPLPAHHPADHPMLYALWENLHRRDCAQRIVQASGLSPAQAARVFHARWQRGIAGTVRRERMDLAKELLSEGLPIHEVARRVGIANVSVFSRAFARQWGRVPRDERAEHREPRAK
jgi:AraC-like DNA-binding protein